MSKRSGFVCARPAAIAPQWAGRCPDCGAWGESRSEQCRAIGRASDARAITVVPLVGSGVDEPVASRTGLPRSRPGPGRRAVAGLGGPARAGRPGSASPRCCCSGSSSMAAGGASGLLVSGEESRAQVAARARRLGRRRRDRSRSRPGAISTTSSPRPARRGPTVLAVDSIQTLRDPRRRYAARGGRAGSGVHRRARGAREERGHRGRAGRPRDEGRRSGRPARPRARGRCRLDVRGRSRGRGSGSSPAARTVSAPRARPPGSRWARPGSRRSTPPSCCCSGERHPGAGGRPPARRPPGARGRDPGPGRARRRRRAGGRSPASIFDGSSKSRRWSSEARRCRSGAPSCSARSRAGSGSTIPPATSPSRPRSSRPPRGVAPPAGAAFVGEIALTGQVRPRPGMEQRISAARAAGCSDAVRPGRVSRRPLEGIRVVTVGHVAEALGWGLSPAGTHPERRAS